MKGRQNDGRNKRPVALRALAVMLALTMTLTTSGMQTLGEELGQAMMSAEEEQQIAAAASQKPEEAVSKETEAAGQQSEQTVAKETEAAPQESEQTAKETEPTSQESEQTAKETEAAGQESEQTAKETEAADQESGQTAKETEAGSSDSAAQPSETEAEAESETEAAKTVHRITFQPQAAEHGTVWVDGAEIDVSSYYREAQQGEKFRFAVTAENGYAVQTAVCGGREAVQVGEDAYEISVADADVEISVVYEKIETEGEAKQEPSGQSFAQTVNDVRITARAAAGVLPENAVMRAAEVENAAADKALRASAEAEGLEVLAIRMFDITFVDENGQEIQPAGEVAITYENIEVPEGAEEALVYHVEDDGSGQKQLADAETTGGRENISFEADHFTLKPVVFARRNGGDMTVSTGIVADGTEPFDTEEGPGFDTGMQNGIVRSLDTLTYAASFDTAAVTPGTIVYFSVTLPLTKQQAEIKLEGLAGKGFTNLVTSETAEGSQILTGAFTVSEGQTSVQLPLVISVGAMNQGDIIAPSIQVSLDSNGLSEAETIPFPRVTVSNHDSHITNADTESNRIEGTIAQSGVSGSSGETGVYDENDAPGNDSSATNNVVRASDQLIYAMEVQMATYSGQPFAQDTLFFEITLPYGSDEVEIDTEAMKERADAYQELTVIPEEGGQTLSGSYLVPAGAEQSAAQTAGLPLVLNVRKLNQGAVIEPSGKFWMKNNYTGNGGTDLECGSHHTVEFITGTYPRVFVSNHDAYISNVESSVGTTGTDPFDTEAGAGKDNDPKDTIVRSFDYMSYDLKVSMDSFAQQKYEEGLIRFEVDLPQEENEAVFDIEAMEYLENCEVVKTTDPETGGLIQTLKGSYRVKKTGEGEEAIPGQQTLAVHIKVLAMKNGDKLQPTGRVWMEGDYTGENGVSVDAVCPSHEVCEVYPVTFPEVTVSAKLRVNVQLKKSEQADTSVVGTFDFGQGNQLNKEKGEVYGRLFACGVTLQMYDTIKGMKGQEIPEGDIIIDMSLSSSYSVIPEGTTGGGTKYSADHEVMKRYQPLLYSVQATSVNDNFTQLDGRSLISKEGIKGNKPYATKGAPSNQGKDGVQSCENGGTWVAVGAESGEPQGDGGAIQIKVSGYEITKFLFPMVDMEVGKETATYYHEGTALEDIKKACFSAGEVWIVQPYKDGKVFLADELGQGTFAIEIRDTKIQVGEEVYAQQYEKDDLITISQYISPPGSFTNMIWYTDRIPGGWRNVHGVNDVGEGDDYSVVGSDNLGATCGFYYDPDGVPENRMVASNTLLKFDGSALRLKQNKIVNGETHEDTVSVYYGYLDDYRNWKDDDELRAATEGSLNWVPMEHADLNQRYVAVLIERRGLVNTISRVRSIYGVYFEARADAVPGQVYMITERTKLWTDGQKIDPDELPSAGKGDALAESAYPEARHGETWDYHKVTYSEKGYDGNHTGGNRYGDSLLLLAYTSKIEMSVAQRRDGAPKKDFNLDKGERTADFVMTPSLVMEHDLVQGGEYTTTTVTIETTLPVGLSYIEGSAYLGGTYTQNEDTGKQGTVTGGVRFREVSAQESFDSETENPVVWAKRGENGETKLTFRFFNVPIKSGLAKDKIYFSTAIGNEADSAKDLANGAQPVIEARISTIEDNQRKFKLENGNLTNAGVHVTKLGAMAFSKTAVKELNEITDDLSWALSWNNNGSNTSTEKVTLLDTMPLADDAHGSSYKGSYKIKSWKLNPDAAGDASKFTVYYTIDSRYRDCVLTSGTGGAGKITWDEVKTWKTLPMNPDGSVDFSGVSDFVYAWAIGGELEGGRSLQIGITVHQDAAAGGDVLVNTASTGVFTRSAPVRRVQRSISGYVWLDEDSNGRMDIQEGTAQGQNETYMQGVTVSLQRQQTDGTWTPAVDLNGNANQMTTGADGYYCFSDLQPGTYRVLFGGGSTGGYETTVYKAAGVVSARNSKAEEPGTGEAGTNAKAVIRNLVLPEADKLSVGVYNLPNQNAGFSRSVELTVTKAWSYIDEENQESVEGTDLPKPERVRVNLYKKNSGGSKTLVRSLELKKDDNWSGTFKKLPAEEAGVEIDYTDSEQYELEEAKADGYTPVIGAIAGNTDSGYTVAITNKAKSREAYEPVSLAIQKYRKGDKKEIAGVTFSLQKQGETEKTEVTTDDSGRASLSFEPDDTWAEVTTYTLKEESAPAGYTPSSATWTVTVTRNAKPVVTVNDAKDGFIRTWEYTVAVTPGTGSDSSFSPKENCLTVYNPYEAEGTLDIPVKKTVSGISNEQAEGKIFSFELYKADQNYGYTATDLLQTKQIEIGADGTGSGTFALKYQLVSADHSMQGDVGTHYYVVKEKTTGLPTGFTRDEREYQLKVTVTDNGDGTLASGADALDAGTPLSFDNHYAASGAAAVTGRKTVTGNNLSAFRFGIFTDEQGTTPVSDGTVVLEDGTDGGTSVANSAEDGSFRFDFRYDMEDLKETVGGKAGYQKVKTFTYYIKETSEASECPGYTLDESVYKVDVTVTDQGDGTLDPVVRLSKKGKGETEFTSGTGMNTAEFVNTYAASATTTVTGRKTVEGGQLKAFTFQIASADGKGLANVKETSVTNDASSGAFQFDFRYDMDALKYYEAIDTERISPKYRTGDSFVYLITEDSSENPTGYTGNGEVYRVVVTVAHDGNGVMTATPVVSKLKTGITAGAVDVTQEAQWDPVPDSVTSFVNRYETDTTQVAVNGVKSIEGANIKAFDFGIYADADCETPVEEWNSEDRTGCVEAQTVQNTTALSAGGTYDFRFVLHYTQESLKNAGGSYAVAKDFTYYVKETSANTAADGSRGYRTDDKVYQVNVRVTDGQDGTIRAAVTSVKLPGTTGAYTEEVSDHVLSFANAYSAKGSGGINGQKTVVNANLSGFTFGIYADEECTQPAPANNVNQTADSDAQTGAFRFNFTYTMDDLRNGESYKDQDTVTYYVKETSQKPGYAENATVYRVAVTVSNASDDGELAVTPEITGVKEGDGGFRTENLPLVLEFTNTYEAAGSVTIHGTKRAEHAVWTDLEERAFTFKLYEGTPDIPATDGFSSANPTARTTANSVQNDSEGNFAFDLHFTMADLKEASGYAAEKDFTFYVKEANVPAGYENTGNVSYKLTCRVTDNGDGTLTPALTGMYRCENGSERTEAEAGTTPGFVNKYLSDGSVTLTISKTLTGNRKTGIEAGEFAFTAKQMEGTGVENPNGTMNPGSLKPVEPEIRYRGEVQEKESAEANGDYVTSAAIELSYTQEDTDEEGNGTYWYLLTEDDIAEEASVEKDSAVFYVRIALSNDADQTLNPSGHHKLSVSATWYDEDGEKLSDGSVPSFTNRYKAEGNIRLTGAKVLTGNRASGMEEGEFTFQILRLKNAALTGEARFAESNIEVVGTGTNGSGDANDAKGNSRAEITFTEIDTDLTADGTQPFDQDDIGQDFTYYIREVDKDGDAVTVVTVEPIEVVIHVEDGDEDGRLKVSRKGTNVPEIRFENHYEAAGSAELEANKTLTGGRAEPIGKGEFAFTAVLKKVLESDGTERKEVVGTGQERVEGSVLQGTVDATTGANTARAVFASVSYDEDAIGKTYVYELRETGGSMQHIVYSEAVYYAAVTVSDTGTVEDGTGVLQTDVVYYRDEALTERIALNEVVFENEYTAQGSEEIPVAKVLTGREWLDTDSFTFTLTETTEASAVADRLDRPAETTVTKEQKESSFVLNYTKPGTHTYWIEESTRDGNGIRMDRARYTVTVVVTDDQKGGLHAQTTLKKVTGNIEEQAADVVFTNHYCAQGGFELEAQKKLLHRGTAVQEGEFTFEAYELKNGRLSEKPVATATTAAGESIASGTTARFADFAEDFFEITEHTVDTSSVLGEHAYIIKEKDQSAENGKGGIRYSGQIYKVVVNVTDEENGELSVTEPVIFDITPEVGQKVDYTAEGTVVTSMGFTNDWLAKGTAVLELDKTLTGSRKDAIAEKEFSFTAVKLAVLDGAVENDPATYTELTGDENKYAGSVSASGPMTQTGKVQTSVAAESAGANAAGQKEQAAWDGTYHTSAGIEIPYTEADLSEDGTAVFWYKLTEDAVTSPAVDRDSAVFYAKIEVQNAPENDLEDGVHKLTAAVTYYDAAGNELPIDDGTAQQQRPSWTNRYHAAGEIAFTAEKELTGGRELAIAPGEFTFEAALEGTKDEWLKRQSGDIHTPEGEADAAQRGAVGSTAAGTSDAEGNRAEVTFGTLHFDETDIGQTYVYALRERNGGMQHIAYSDAVYYATVAVSDSGEFDDNVGKLLLQVEYYSDAVLTDPVGKPVFSNAYSAQGSEEIPVAKVLTGREWLDTDSFTFTLTETTEASAVADRLDRPAETTVTKEQQESSFVLNYTKPGTHTYWIEESTRDGDGIKVDPARYMATVKVTDNQKGGLRTHTTLVKLTEDRVESAEEVTFTNEYHAEGTAVLEGTKRLTGGRELPMMNGEFTFRVTENGKEMTTGAVKADGTIAFEPIIYTEQDLGVHTYEIREDAGRDQNITYSSQIFRAEVTVADRGDGTLDIRTSYPQGAIAFENQYTERVQSSIRVTKHLSYNGMSVNTRDHIFYVALFSDEELKDRVSDVRPLTFENQSVSTVTLGGLAAGRTYYVAETDQSGTAFRSGVLPSGDLFEAVFPSGNRVQIGENGGEAELYFENTFPTLPEGFLKEGELTITKKLMSSDGAQVNSDETFYAGIFADENHTELSRMVSQNIVALDLNGGSEVSEVIRVSFGDGGSQTVYVAEVDQNGKPVADGSDFRYEIRVDKTSVTLSEQNVSDSVTITNTEYEEIETETEIETGTEKKSSKKSVKTGDETPIALYAVLFVAAAAVLLILLGSRRKYRRK